MMARHPPHDEMTTISTIGRKRGRPELRDDVLALIHRCHAPMLVRQQRLKSLYDAAWKAFCRVMNMQPEEPAVDSAAKLNEALTQLQRDVEDNGGVMPMTHILVDTIARSVASATRGSVRHRQLLLVWIWLGHSRRGLWRFENVLAAVASLAGRHESNTFTSEWLDTAIRSLMENQSRGMHQRKLLHLHEDASVTNQIVAYLVRLAFTKCDDELLLSSDVASLSHDTLVALCTSCDAGRPHGSFPLVSEIILKSITKVDDSATASAMQLFLRGQVKRLLLVIASSPVYTTDTSAVNEILSIFQKCVPPADVVQLFRQVWSEAAATISLHKSNTSSDPIDSLSALISGCASRDPAFKSQALASAHDLAHDAISASDATTLRTSLDLAAAATARTDAVGATENNDMDTDTDTAYGDWFRSHFAAASVQTATVAAILQQPLPNNPPLCIRSAAATTTATMSCVLVSSKRHLQFLCAFLSEFDRMDSPHRRAHHVLAHLSAMKTHQTQNGGSSSVVAGLLSDFCSQTRQRRLKLQAKEQQAKAQRRRQSLSGNSNSSSTTTTTTTSSNKPSLSLESSDSAVVTTTNTQTTPPFSQYAESTRTTVEELLVLFKKDEPALVTRVNRMKMFERSLWKQQILPCCLDFPYWLSCSSTTEASDVGSQQHVKSKKKKKAKELVAFVQVLATHHAVGTHEYVLFLERAESWFKTQQHQQQQGVSSRRLHSSMDTSIEALRLAVDAYFDNRASVALPTVVEQSWAAVAEAVVAAFDDLACQKHPSSRQSQLQAIFELIVMRPAAVTASSSPVTTPGGGEVDRTVQDHLLLWISLLSSESGSGSPSASPEDRLEAMEAYCKLAVDQAKETTKSEEEISHVHHRQGLVRLAMLGSLLGLLASLTMCEQIALASTHAIGSSMLREGRPAESSEEAFEDHKTRQLERESAFLSGFLTGYTTNPTSHAPPLLLQRMLPPHLFETLVWLGHHARVWWSEVALASTTTTTTSTTTGSEWWSFVSRVLHHCFDTYAWFGLAFSPGVLTTKTQWRSFWENELFCCATRLLGTDKAVESMVFVGLQIEQIDTLVFASSAGQMAGVTCSDMCSWIAETTIRVVSMGPRAQGTAPPIVSSLDALVLLLKEVWRSHSPSNSISGYCDVLVAIMESTIKSSSSTMARTIITYGLRCCRVILDGVAHGSQSHGQFQFQSQAVGETAVLSPQLVKAFVDCVAKVLLEKTVHPCVSGSTPTMAHMTSAYEWVSTLWCLAMNNIPDAATMAMAPATEAAFQHANDLPAYLFAHWAFEFPRLCRLLHHPRTMKKKNHIGKRTNTIGAFFGLLDAVQTCHSFFKTLGVRRLALSIMASSSIGGKLGFSLSQHATQTQTHTQSSASRDDDDGRLLLHVRSLEWLLQRGLLPIAASPLLSTSSFPDLKTSLAFHTTANRVLTALLDDVPVSRPDDVAMELAQVCRTLWLAKVAAREPSSAAEDNTTGVPYQLLLVHIVAELAVSYACVSRLLARQPHTKNSVGSSSSLFVALVLIASKETEQLESVLGHNGSLWVNAFAALACALVESPSPSPSQTHGLHQPAETPPLVALLTPLDAFQQQLETVLTRVLKFALAKQIDLLDLSVCQRIRQHFPAQRDLLARVPVLDLAEEDTYE